MIRVPNRSYEVIKLALTGFALGLNAQTSQARSVLLRPWALYFRLHFVYNAKPVGMHSVGCFEWHPAAQRLAITESTGKFYKMNNSGFENKTWFPFLKNKCHSCKWTRSNQR